MIDMKKLLINLYAEVEYTQKNDLIYWFLFAQK